MTTRTLALGSIAAMALSALPACSSPAPASEAAVSQPNIIVIETDDMRMDDLQAMPQTRALMGASYSNFYASTPVCCPSRATFLTGQTAHHTGVWSNTGPNGGVDQLDDAETLPVWLQRGGYDTSLFGKYLNGYGDPADGTAQHYVPPGWSTWAALSYDSRNDYTDFDYVTGSSGPEAPSTTTGAETVTNGYQTKKFTSLAVNHIKDTPGPKFMWVSYFAPHTGVGDGGQEWVPAEPKYAGQSKLGLPQTPAVDEANIADKPPWIRDLPRLSAASKAKIISYRRERRDALRTVDDSVVRIVNALRDTGELADTVLVFTSDNGFMQGEHRIDWGKVVPYMESARVPLLIRGPGFTPGTHTELVSNADLAPTFAEIAGVTPGHPVDGVSMLGTIPVDRSILLESLASDDWKGGATTGPLPAYRSVIQNRWQWTEWDGAQELYDLANDPYQQRNRAGDPAFGTIRKELAAELGRLR